MVVPVRGVEELHDGHVQRRGGKQQVAAMTSAAPVAEGFEQCWHGGVLQPGDPTGGLVGGSGLNPRH